MAQKSQRKLQREVEQKKAVREKDLGLRLMIGGQLLAYFPVMLLVLGLTSFPTELYSIAAFAGYGLTAFGLVMVERAFKKVTAE